MSLNFEFSLDLSAEKILSIYEGQAKYILVFTDDRLKLQLPAVNFRTFVTETGIQGRFRVRTDAQYRLQKLEKIG